MRVRRRSTRLPSATRPPPVVLTANANRLLATLPPEDYARIAANLEAMPLTLKHILHKPGETVQHVYFPGGGFCSVVSVLEDGNMVEVATIGREGMVGVSAVLDGGPVPFAAMVQAESNICYRIETRAFRREMDRRGTLHEVVTRYTQALVAVIMQTTACNAVHSVEQRLARWLLMAQDHLGRAEFPLTQEFVAMMLGATRPTVTVVAGMLQKAGLITYHRGDVIIADREGLEDASCECYRASAALLEAVTDGSRTREG